MYRQLRFDPCHVAYFEKAGWEAYYNRQWGRVLALMARLNREQFRMPSWVAVAAALDTVRAAKAFAPVENDIIDHCQNPFLTGSYLHQTLCDMLF